MIADGRETALIPFMLRPFRCTDTRGRQARPRQYSYACVWGMGDLSPHAHKWSPITSVGRTPHISLSVWLCMRERGSKCQLCAYTSTLDQGEAFGASPYLLKLIWTSSWNSHFFKVCVFHTISAFTQIRELFENPYIYICLKEAHIIEYKSVFLKYFSFMLQAEKLNDGSKVLVICFPKTIIVVFSPDKMVFGRQWFFSSVFSVS